jgi:hypothetical protein
MATGRIVAGVLLLVTVAACGGGAVASGPAGAPPTGTSASPGSSGAGPSTAAVDLSGLDVCALVDVAVVEALTGETGFDADGSSSGSSAKCFWGVPRPGVPQYLEVSVSRRTAGLADYTLNVNGVACPAAAVSGVGVEARGGVCTGAQTKVWLIAMDRGVAVEAIVNEPRGTLTPEDLADLLNAVIAGLG